MIKKLAARLPRFTKLEVFSFIVIAVLALNSLFSFKISIGRKPILNKLVGSQNQTKFLSETNVVDINSSARGLQAVVLPEDGVVLPVAWGDLGKQLVNSGTIDDVKFKALAAQRGGLTAEMESLLYGEENGQITITPENNGFLLNLFWALGLANENPILESGEMVDPKYGGDASRFASTGGWTLADGDVMDHYSAHKLIKLTAGQQILVDKVSQNIYRPCCGNSVHFPDCNHGMAMLGLLQLIASQGVSEQDMYKYALAVNSYWFPDTYLTIGKYLETQGQDYKTTDPQILLSAQYSSGQGYKQILSKVQPVQSQGGNGCGV
ncbi:MAG: hypothetical protein COT92_00325 [Candidatus Doudnabacteria bacterium CG10_big_fil_rev_8_21_14_0_10_42_18]|uniref:Uncharacterized protein n=1 Tax=Candidatus Doudnabacteria bacterium CG10_big_fil_rev_8_21_14_0_10_42_18 TaxID=1974552 RepID=A0A2H0VBX1_9BACT|nr:MAG: hypothetical protein COT92_00325 [Candidatus Doudnabacteria bacterium CG10_big_fil_rev_8_21_14_0_10_42_18]